MCVSNDIASRIWRGSGNGASRRTAGERRPMSLRPRQARGRASRPSYRRRRLAPASRRTARGPQPTAACGRREVEDRARLRHVDQHPGADGHRRRFRNVASFISSSLARLAELYTILFFVDNQAGFESVAREERDLRTKTRLSWRSALLATSAMADPIKIKIACTATSDCASAMIATYDGVFAKHGR